MPKFYELTPSQRLAVLVETGELTAQEADQYAHDWMVPQDVAEALTENQISQFALPLGVLRDLPVNGQQFLVPMATEEPSVIAAANNGARIARLNGGVRVVTPEHLVTGEVVFDHVTDVDFAKAQIYARQPEIYAAAQIAKPSIVARGGGLKRLKLEVLNHRFLKLSLIVDPKAAMGANIVNTIAEAVGHLVGTWLKQVPLVSVLSNAGAEPTSAEVMLDPKTLATAGEDGETIANRIAAVSDLAQVDLDRATTHNKGIMNGITAVALASGNDTRALEVAAHAFAAKSGHYAPLSRWQIQPDGQLYGQLQLPLVVGTVGGAISALPLARLNQQVAQIHEPQTLRAILAATGLVQNLAALRALVGPGIQAGHMALQANALAIAAGATGEEIALVVQALQTQPKDLATATALLQKLRQKD